jgi:hypothetical protein
MLVALQSLRQWSLFCAPLFMQPSNAKKSKLKDRNMGAEERFCNTFPLQPPEITATLANALYIYLDRRDLLN